MYLDFENIFDTVYKESGNIDKTIAMLKQGGASQMETEMLLIMKLKLSLSEADLLVVNSESWKENKDTIEKFRNDFADFIKKVDADSL